jgi:hypothetical protein
MAAIFSPLGLNQASEMSQVVLPTSLDSHG